MRKTIKCILLESDRPQCFGGSEPSLGARAPRCPQRFDESSPHRISRIQRVVRVLKGHSHRSPIGHSSSPRKTGDILSIHGDGALSRSTRESYGTSEPTLPTLWFSDQTERLALRDLRGGIVEGAELVLAMKI